MEWSARPFVRLVLFLLLGIFLAYYVPTIQKLTLTTALVFFSSSLLLVIIISLRLKSFRFRGLSGIVIGVSLVLLGIVLGINKLEAVRQNPTLLQSESFTARVVGEPEIKQETVKSILKVTPTANRTISVKVIAFFEKDSLAKKLGPGDLLVFKGRLKKAGSPQNPMAFDYGEYLRQNGIAYLSFLRTGQWKKLASGKKSLWNFPYRLRKKLITSLHSNGLSGKEYAVASAILLGYNRLMDPKIRNEYAAAGAVHILCVSGMHVGIIYIVFSFLLSFLNRNKRQKLLKTILLLFIIWSYAMLTGLSPSVWRAALMVSLFIVAENLQRDSDPFNTLAASAFILLIVNPFFIFNIGFQLSYAAVLGILIFYHPLYGLLYIKNVVFDKIWSIVVLSTSAQLGAFPIAAHYFHSFPLYFLLTNIAVFFLAYFIVTVGLAFILFSSIGHIAFLLGKFLSATVFLTNLIIHFVASLPHAQFTGLYFPLIKVVLVYSLILFLFLWIYKKNSSFLFPLLTSLFVLLAFATLRKFDRLKQSEFVVYAIPHHTAADIINGNQHFLIADTTLIKQRDKLSYANKNFLIALGLNRRTFTLQGEKKFQDDYYFFNKGFLAFENYRTFFTGVTPNAYPPLAKKIVLDYLIITGKAPVALKTMESSFDFKEIILTSSLPSYRRKQAIQQAKVLNIKYYDIREKGAFILR